MIPKLEQVIHQESLPGGRLKGYARNVTYTIDEEKKLMRYEFVNEDPSRNWKKEITQNPLYCQIFGDIIPIEFSALVGTVWGAGLGKTDKQDLESVLVVGSLVYLALLPFRGQVYHNLLADKRAWDKYRAWQKKRI